MSIRSLVQDFAKKEEKGREEKFFRTSRDLCSEVVRKITASNVGRHRIQNAPHFCVFKNLKKVGLYKYTMKYGTLHMKILEALFRQFYRAPQAILVTLMFLSH